jgi:hypothetical protein
MYPFPIVALATVLLLLPFQLRGQATVVSAPDKDYLLDITRSWSRSSPLGDLREIALGVEDLEIRAWGGYGLGGTGATIIRRRSGQWSAWQVRRVRCRIIVPTAVADTASQQTQDALLAQAKRQCGASSDDNIRSGSIFTADTLGVVEMRDRASAAERVWRDASTAGLLTLPPEPAKEVMMLDGYHFVLEVRQGKEYRASVFPYIQKSDDAALERIKRVYEAIAKSLGT